jgi:hypothetical protein
MNDNPVFICGIDRSGKTYMRFMLNAHPSFAISKRTKLWQKYYLRFGDLGNSSNLAYCLQVLAGQKHIQSLELDFCKLNHDFEIGPQTYERLFALIQLQYAQSLGKPRWGDQGELLEKKAVRILQRFPNAKFIHMLRDPRDRYEAALHKSKRRGGIGAATSRWLYSASLANRNQQKYPQRYKVVRYENMVSQTEDTMYEVCQFLGESYHPAMISMKNEKRFSNHNLKKNRAQSSPLSTSYIGRFRENLPDHEIYFIQKLSKRYMKLFNYPLAPIHFTKPEIFRLSTSYWFVNITQAVGWRVRNKVAF